MAKGIVGYNPIISGQLTKEEINLSSDDKNRPLKISSYEINIDITDKKIKIYTW